MRRNVLIQKQKKIKEKAADGWSQRRKMKEIPEKLWCTATIKTELYGWKKEEKVEAEFVKGKQCLDQNTK